MFKINQVAHMLGVSTVDIHSQLIEQRDCLTSNIHKTNGITFIDAEGVKIIARFLEERSSANESTATLESNESHDGIDVDAESSFTVDLILETDLDTEMQVFRFRESISRLKSQINRIDQEILLKDEAIEHYLKAFEKVSR